MAPLLVLALAGCAQPGPFVERPSENVERPRVRIANETEGAIYVTLKARTEEKAKEKTEEKTEERIDVAPWSYTIDELASGVYDYQIFIEGRVDFPAAWFTHGPKGRVELRDRHRYTWRWRPRD